MDREIVQDARGPGAMVTRSTAWQFPSLFAERVYVYRGRSTWRSGVWGFAGEEASLWCALAVHRESALRDRAWQGARVSVNWSVISALIHDETK